MRLPLVFTSLLLVFVLTTAAQISPTESQSEKDKAAQELEKDALKLVQKSAAEAGGLKLWQNRALVFALAGDLFWKTDQKKARTLFRDAANELVAGSQAPKEEAKDYYDDYNWWDDTSPRRPVLLTIAAYDAELALEMLLETRPADLQAAINAYNQPQPITAVKKTQMQIVKENANKYKAQQEIQLEQQFAVKAAEQDPKKGAKLLRDSLAKGFSQSIADLLGKINEKDEALGKELLNEVLQKLFDTDFKQKDDAINLGSYFLRQSYSAEAMKAQNPKFKQIKIEDRDLRALAVKFADFLIVNLDLNRFWQFSQLSPMLEKYVPEKMPLLRQKEAEVKKVMPDEWESWMDVNKLTTDPNTTAERLLEEAEKYAGWEKYTLYKTAVEKAIAAGTGDKIRTALQNQPDSKQRNDALDYLDSKISEKALKDDKLDDVQKLIARSESASAKVKLLVNLATGYQKKNTEESHKIALNFMSDARKLVGDIPESRKEAIDFLKIAAGYAEIEPDSAFPMLEPLIDMTNDMLTAYALLSKYNKSESMFRQGELIFLQGIGFGTPYLEFGKELKALAKFDFEKVENLTDRIRRDDMKILVRILLAQSILKEKLTIDGVRSQYYGDDF
jgi:hypothetical protein